MRSSPGISCPEVPAWCPDMHEALTTWIRMHFSLCRADITTHPSSERRPLPLGWRGKIKWRSDDEAASSRWRDDVKASNLEKLNGYSISIEGRGFQVASVTSRKPDGITPAFSLLEIRAEPALRVDLALPKDWNGRLYMNGNGGYAGEPVDSPLRDFPRALALSHGYAVVGTNTGHDADVEPLAAFATNREKLIDYAYRAVHQSVLVGKALLEEIYGKEPDYAYFEGCSTGGRQALMAAQRFPDDFDGIIAGAPVLDFTGSQLWGVRTGQYVAGAGIDAKAMRAVASVVNGKFGDKDGRNPALIADPLGADFDIFRDVPISDDGREGTITHRQAEAIAKVYEPAPIGKGRSFPGMPIGGEAIGVGQPGFPPTSGWEGWMYPSSDGFFAGAPAGVRVSFGETFLNEMLGYKGTWQDFDFADATLEGLEDLSDLMDATAADLSRFAKKGGKLILYHGLADVALNAARTIAYYEAMKTELGSEVDDFVRFYLPPGMFHCFGGYGPDQFDMLSPLTRWVEQGDRPETIIATQRPNPANPADVSTRPLCPYPAIATYDGKGDPATAASYLCA